nr:DMT family transporter [Propionibacterium sp.]
MPGVTLSTRRTRANLLLLLCAAIWGFAFVAQVAGAHVGAFTFNATRFALGAASLLPVVAVLDRRGAVTRAQGTARWRDALAPGALCGVFLATASTLQQKGIESTTAGNAAFVTGLYVVMVPLVGVFLGHRITRTIWLGVSFAVVGLYLLTMTEGIARMNPGDLLCLVSTVFWTSHILAIGRFARRCDPLRLSVVQFAACSAYCAVGALATESTPFTGLHTAVVPLLYAGVVSVGVAYTLQVVGQQDALASHAALIMSLETVFGAVGGALLLGERMAPIGYLGAGLMLVGIVLSQLEPRRRDAHPVPVPEPPSTALDDEPLVDEPLAGEAGVGVRRER